ncbi:carbon monoxide dehydrogenase [Polymorphobacter glacialis]|uniref:Carbon monoxide dehydrogenase n=1 Tax=Sandarakinorhabdus glacialis TaxID=1614636 RepID=A0A916ZSU7_9SPHN|nr:xanthine dehydrogenase family protein subunit M [Polymorphobacter glacialis]GGE12450.1 carbon monoxide dehydrogenase [Polymorphobacter glacialis]
MRDFDYSRPTSLADAAAAFANGGEAAFIAGGHTLLPAIKSRLRMPDTIIDLSAIPGLTGVSREADTLWVGAMTTHAVVALEAGVISGLAQMAALIGDPQVRNRGTIGGVIANNDPSADYPAALVALDATVETDRASYAADDFFQGMFSTALADGEIVTRIGFKIPQASAYAKFRNPASRYAVAGVFVARFGSAVRVAVTGAGPAVFRWPEAEAALSADFKPAAVAGLRLDDSDLNTDIHASAEFRAHLVGVMLAKAITDAR